MRRAPVVLLCCAVLVAQIAGAARGRHRTRPGAGRLDTAERLLRVVTPAGGRIKVAAHPFVNIVVRLGTPNGTVDPASFRAHLGSANVTDLFEPVFEQGRLAGMRAALMPPLIKVGHGTNHLRIDVRGRIGKRRRHDVDRIRFAAVDAPDHAPVAHALAPTEIVFPGVPEQFDGSQSSDPDDDALQYLWDFGDGTTATDVRPTHVFGPTSNDIVVRLTVSDGQLAASDQVTLLAVPALCPGCTPGILRVDADGPLEFGGVPLGSNSILTFTVRNIDVAPTSDLHVRLVTAGGAFTLGATDVDLRAGGSTTVPITFAPTAPGHQSTDVAIVASASNQTVVHLLTHGYGGAAPGTGPLPVSDPLFFSAVAGTEGVFPSGARFAADDTVRTCQVGLNAPGTGDYCLTDADCAANGGTCPTTGTCIGGDRPGTPCTVPGDCPNGFGCSAAFHFGPVKMCGDGAGGLFMLSDDGTYTDPNPNADTQLDGTLMHVRYDGSGNRVGADIVLRTTETTSQIACQPSGPAAADVYMAEYHAVLSTSTCFRDSREALVSIDGNTGTETTLVSRIDAVEGLGPCDDYDPSDDLESTRDGSAVFVALPGGIIRVRPTPLLITPDVDDIFQVHPDGSVLAVARADDGATGTLRLYKIRPEQAANGAPHLSDLTPCATIDVPSNRGVQKGALTTIVSFAVDPIAPGSFDATVLLSFFTGGGASPGPGLAAPLSPALHVQGTYAIASPAGSNACSVIGLVDLEPLDQMSF